MHNEVIESLQPMENDMDVQNIAHKYKSKMQATLTLYYVKA